MCSSATSSGVATSWLTKCSVWIYCDELEDKLSSASSSDIDTIQPCVTNSWDSSLVLIDLFIPSGRESGRESIMANILQWFLLLLMLRFPPPERGFSSFHFFTECVLFRVCAPVPHRTELRLAGSLSLRSEFIVMSWRRSYPQPPTNSWDSSFVLIDLFILLDENLFSSSMANIRPWFLLLMLQFIPHRKEIFSFRFFLRNVSCLGCVLQCHTERSCDELAH